MNPELNTQPEPIEPGREAAGARVRHISGQDQPRVVGLRAIDPHRAQLVARARTRLASGALDTEDAFRAAALAFLSGPETGAV